MGGDPNRLLLISLSNVGDAVMTTPVLELMHQRYPEAAIDIVADRRASGLFQHCPYRGRVLHKDKSAGWRGLWRLVRTLRQGRYELIVDLRTDGLAYLLRAKRRLSKWGAGAPCGPHAVDKLLAIAAPLLAAGSSPPAPRLWLDSQLRRFADGEVSVLPGRRWLALGPGARWPRKIWAVERYAEMAGQLGDRFDAVIVLGGPADRETAARLAQGLALPCLNLAGRTTLLEDCAVLERVQFYVGNDSGLGHMAAALGVPSLTVFGPTDPQRFRPWGTRAAWIAAPDGDLDRLPACQVAARVRTLVNT
ncbi:MAG: glycosyltransferase family 9 protein [Gammaproteobacteria bacterium]